jgi:periplasmic divalent cation tolerance protein
VSKKNFVVFVTTFSEHTHAQAFARLLVQKNLAACVNVIPGVVSHYKWKNQVRADSEFLLMGKTTLSSFKKIKKNIKTLHTYSLPELICYKIEDGSAEYLKWVASGSKA